MKKLIYIATALTLSFSAASCQQENTVAMSGGTAVAYTVSVPAALAAKALGDEISANVLKYEVYRQADLDDMTKDPIYEGTAPVDAQGNASFKLEFVKNQSFTVLFWAQNDQVTAYNTSDLRAVTLSTSQSCNDIAAAVFSGSDKVVNCVSASNGAVELFRPVSQLNLATSPASLKLGTKDIQLIASSAEVSGLYSTYNVATKEVSAAATYTYSSAAVPSGSINVDGTHYTYVSMNYVGFAPETDGATISVDYIITTSEGEIAHSIPNVPVKPDYRTNIIGNLITGSSAYSIALDNAWNDSIYDVWAGGTKEVTTDPADPAVYPVSRGVHLAWISQQLDADIDNFVGKTIRLDSDIYLGAQWKTLDAYTAAGKITFDGNGKTIYGLTAPLFGRYSGDVKDLTISNAHIRSNEEGTATFCTSLEGDLTNVTVKNSTLTSLNPTAQTRYWGGLVGVYNAGNATACKADNVTLTGFNMEAGGLFGAITTTGNRQFRNCSAVNCNIDPTSPVIGAIVGYIYPAGIEFYGCSQTGCTPTNLVGGGDPIIHNGEII